MLVLSTVASVRSGFILNSSSQNLRYIWSKAGTKASSANERHEENGGGKVQ